MASCRGELAGLADQYGPVSQHGGGPIVIAVGEVELEEFCAALQPFRDLGLPAPAWG